MRKRARSGPPAHIMPGQYAEFTRQYFARVPYKIMAFNFNCTVATIYNTRIRLKLPPRKDGTSMKNIAVRVNKQTYKKLLEKIYPTPLASYIRGLITADLNNGETK